MVPRIPAAKPKPPTGQEFWKANPKLAYAAIQYLSQHSTDQGLSHQLLSNKQQFQQLTGGPEGRNAPHVARQLVHTQLGALQRGGVDDRTARIQLLAELMQAAAGHHDKIKSPTKTIGDPIETLYKMGNDPTSQLEYAQNVAKHVDESVVKLGGAIADPYEALKKTAKPKDAQVALLKAVFARSPQGQQALLQSVMGNPQNAAKLARVQLENQVVTQFSQIAGSGGVADQYDAYLADKEWRKTATAKEKRAAGPAMEDPLTQLGYSRASFNIPKGEVVTGSSIRAAMLANLDKERQSLRQIGKPGDPGFATGVPIAGTQIDKFIKDLEKTGLAGKKLAQAMQSKGLSGQDAFLAYQELQQQGHLDPTLAAAMQGARVSGRLPKLPKQPAAGTTGTSTGPLVVH